MPALQFPSAGSCLGRPCPARSAPGGEIGNLTGFCPPLCDQHPQQVQPPETKQSNMPGPTARKPSKTWIHRVGFAPPPPAKNAKNAENRRVGADPPPKPAAFLRLKRWPAAGWPPLPLRPSSFRSRLESAAFWAIKTPAKATGDLVRLETNRQTTAS